MSVHFANTPVLLKELTTAATPISGVLAFYAKTDNKLYYKDDLGVETAIGAGGSGINGSTNLWIPAAQLVPKTTAGCGVNSRETTTFDQNYDTCVFDSVTQEYADFTVVMPNNYDLSTITAKFHWTAFTAATGTVAWGIQGVSLTNDDPLDSASGTAQTTTDTFILSGDEHVTDYTSGVTIAGSPQANERVQFTVFRDPANDTLAADAELIGIEIVYNGGASPTPVFGTKTIGVFTPRDNQPPATAFATLDTRNSVAILDFDDGATNEAAVFVGVIPEASVLTSGIKVIIKWTAATATSGNCRWGAEWEKEGTDIDSDSFATPTEVSTPTSGTSGVINTTEITCTTIDSLAAGDAFRLRIYRDSSDTINDTMTGDAELIVVEIRTAN